MRCPSIFKLTQQHTKNWEARKLFLQCTIFPAVDVPPPGYGRIYSIFSNDKRYDVTIGNFHGFSCIYFGTMLPGSMKGRGVYVQCKCVYHCHQKRGTQTTTRPLQTLSHCLWLVWHSAHTHTNRAFTTTCTDPDSFEPPADTNPPQGFQDRISQFRIAQKVSANTSVQPPRTLNQGLRSIRPLSHSPPETDHSNLLISFTPPTNCHVLQLHSLLDPILFQIRS